MKPLIEEIAQAYQFIRFEEAETFLWKPQERTVCYSLAQDTLQARWSLFHEVSHGILEHTVYKTDLELLLLEVEAWQYAKKLQRLHDKASTIDEDHIQDCLDTYRDWLHSRSICPACDQTGIQQDNKTYRCINCQQNWLVSAHRFKRPYRLCISPTQQKASPTAISNR